MKTLHRTVESVLSFMQDELTAVARKLETLTPFEVGDMVADVDMRLRRVYEGAEAARRYVALHRPAECRYYKPAETVRTLKGTRSVSPFTIDVQADRECYGDPDQVLESLRIVLRNIRLEDAGGITVELLLASDQPKILLSTENPSAIPETFALEGMLSIDLRQLGRCWIGATHGGHIHIAADGLVMYLDGNTVLPEPYGDMGALQIPLDIVTNKLNPWRAATGHFEEGLVGPEEVITLYNKAVGESLHQVKPALEAARALEL